jgi:hypothetical protein
MAKKIPDYVNEWFAKHPTEYTRPAIVCKDGTVLSIQASKMHYCTPKESNAAHYTTAELGMFDGRWYRSLGPKQEDGIYGFASIEKLNAIIHRRGGIK